MEISLYNIDMKQYVTYTTAIFFTYIPCILIIIKVFFTN